MLRMPRNKPLPSHDLDTHLTALTDAAAGYMSRAGADELSRNLVMGLAELDIAECSYLERFAYVHGAIERRMSFCGLEVSNAQRAASAIVNAWTAAGVAA